MSYYAKESLELLRQKIDLVEVVGEYVKMTRSGSSYKGLCPFHEENTPSFVIQRGDSHYHCFGCSAHGDAIAFLMEYVKMNFTEALEYLAERFQVSLEKVETEEKGPNKGRLKDLLERATAWYHFFLLHADEAREGLAYLYQRGLSLEFIRRFELGYAPKQPGMLQAILRKEGFFSQELEAVGLIRTNGKDFFSERILFPIRDKMGGVIGFSGRKCKAEIFGGKYINTPETVLFKKSQVLFGLCYSRARMAKEQKALIVEGQIDALRLIDAGFDYTVASQGTAFGEGHAKELLQLGINQVFLAFDSDKAGKEATIKVGQLFQSKGIEVNIVQLPPGSDPDIFLNEQGPKAFESLVQGSQDFISFYYSFLCAGSDISSPSKKSQIIETIAEQVRGWEHPVMIHETLKKLASLAAVPEETVGGITKKGFARKVPIFEKSFVDGDLVLEIDLLRWLFRSEEKKDFILDLVENNLSKEDFKVPACGALFSVYIGLEENHRRDWILIASSLKTKQEQEVLEKILDKSVNPAKEEEGSITTVHKMLLRGWMERRKQIHEQITQGQYSDEEEGELTRQYVELSQAPPEVTLP